MKFFEFFEFSFGFRCILPPTHISWINNKLGELWVKFKSLTDGERDQILAFLRSRPAEPVRRFREDLIRSREITVDGVFDKLCREAAAYNPYALKPLIVGLFGHSIHFIDRSSASSVQSLSQRLAASLTNDGYPLRNTDVVLTPSDAVDFGWSHGTIVLNEFDKFRSLLFRVLPGRFIVLSSKKFDEFQDKFKALTDQERNQILALLGGCSPESIIFFHRMLDAGPTAVDTVFHALLMTVNHFSRDPVVVLTPPDVVDSAEFDKWFPQFLPENLLAFYHNNCDGFQDKFKSLTHEERDQILMLVHKRPPGSIRNFRQGLNVGRTAATIDNIFLALRNTAALYFHLVFTPRIADESGLSLCHHHFVYPSSASSSQPHSERPAADDIHGPTEISPFDDPGASTSSSSPASPSPAAASHSYDEPLEMATGAQPLLQRSQASDGTSPGRQREFNEMSNRIESDFQRPEASANNPPADVGDTVIRVSAEARATRDDKTAGDSKYYDTLAPLNYTNAEKAFKILKSTHRSTLPFPIKTSGYLTVILSGAAFLLSLAGLGLSTFKPNTLLHGRHHQRIMQIIHNAVLHTTAYAFIGTMCHEYLQDDPFLMCMVSGIAFAFFNVIMWYVARRG